MGPVSAPQTLWPALSWSVCRSLLPSVGSGSCGPSGLSFRVGLCLEVRSTGTPASGWLLGFVPIACALLWGCLVTTFCWVLSTRFNLLFSLSVADVGRGDRVRVTEM